VFLILPTLASSINLISHFFGHIEYEYVFRVVLSLYFVGLVVTILILRKDKKYYFFSVSILILTTLLLFYFVLLTRVEDEFRLIAFFIYTFMIFALLGKKVGLFAAVFVALSIFLISQKYDLQISSLAYNSFYSFFIPFAILLFYILDKIEKDALAYQVLNSKLEERVKQETNQRLEQEQMLLRRSRMANIGEMMDSIAHQWRQPLMHINSILLNVESTIDSDARDIEKGEYVKAKVDEIANLTTHMSQTIEDFRGLFKAEKEYVSFMIQDVVSDVLDLLKNNLNDIEIDHIKVNEVSVLGHRSELMQVIIIVLSNAIDALKSREIQNKKITISIESSTNVACINIEDNAGGIDANHSQAIFDPYFTTKEQAGGTGLGLYIAKIIVKHNMEGDISCTNTSVGAKFSISMLKKPSKNPSISEVN